MRQPLFRAEEKIKPELREHKMNEIMNACIDASTWNLPFEIEQPTTTHRYLLFYLGSMYFFEITGT